MRRKIDIQEMDMFYKKRICIVLFAVSFIFLLSSTYSMKICLKDKQADDRNIQIEKRIMIYDTDNKQISEIDPFSGTAPGLNLWLMRFDYEKSSNQYAYLTYNSSVKEYSLKVRGAGSSKQDTYAIKGNRSIEGFKWVNDKEIFISFREKADGNNEILRNYRFLLPEGKMLETGFFRYDRLIGSLGYKDEKQAIYYEYEKFIYFQEERKPFKSQLITEGINPNLSPDGKYLAYQKVISKKEESPHNQQNDMEHYGLYLKELKNKNKPDKCISDPANVYFLSMKWSPDGRYLLISYPDKKLMVFDVNENKYIDLGNLIEVTNIEDAYWADGQNLIIQERTNNKVFFMKYPWSASMFCLKWLTGKPEKAYRYANKKNLAVPYRIYQINIPKKEKKNILNLDQSLDRDYSIRNVFL
jgi:WD40 repeat protein